MYDSKYIVVTDVDKTIEKMIIFPNSMKHKTIAKSMVKAEYPIIVSAGFIDMNFQCYGESFTIGKSSRGKQDTELLNELLKKDKEECDFCKDRYASNRYNFCARCGKELKIKS